jgi:Fe-Mn family superoxide dismutase
MNGLEPVISQNLMEYHYGKHHVTYINNYNALIEQAAEAHEKGDTQKYVNLSQGIKFNGGGHLNHEFFWDNLAPIGSGGGELPAEDSDLSMMICHQWGSMDDFITHFSTNTAGVQGSGWGWLAYNKSTKQLEFRTTANQDRLCD